MSSELKKLINYGKSLNVLFVEDNKEVREQLLKLLKNFFSNIDIADDGLIALKKYEEFNYKNELFYDIIITDLSMPKMDGIEFVQKIMNQNPHQVIVVISAHTESVKLLKLIEIGVYKFLRKPVDYRDFLTNFSSIVNKIKREKNYIDFEKKLFRLEKENRLLNEQAVKDKLTSTYNRKFLDNLLYEKFERLKNNSNEKNFIMILIYIDDFTLINDNYGYLIGDEVLIEFANLLKNSIRITDIIGRWKDEKFVIILERTHMNDAFIIVEKLKKIIKEKNFDKIGKVTASLGLATYKEGDSISSFIQRADYSLYKVKEDTSDL